MRLASSKITAQGQISIPAEVRRKLGVGPGSVLEWETQDDHIVVRRAGRYTSEDIHQRLFVSKPKRHTLKELKAGIGKYIRDRDARN